MKLIKRSISLALVAAFLITGMLGAVPAQETQAAPRLSKSSVTLTIGKSTTLRVKGTTKKIVWRSTKKSVASVNSKGKVVAKKPGNARICAKFSGKKLFCNVTVTGSSADTKAGGRLNPLSAYKEHTINYYDDGKKIGTFKIKLNSFLSGQKASEKILSNPENLKPTNSQEYIYFQFNVKYVSGTEVVDLKDVFSYYYNIFDSTGTKQLENIDWGFFFELMEDLSDVTLSPGQSSKCSKAILVSKGNTPVLYRIRTGRTSYTWFTTKK